jgi:hypothetical protein
MKRHTTACAGTFSEKAGKNSKLFLRKAGIQCAEAGKRGVVCLNAGISRSRGISAELPIPRPFIPTSLSLSRGPVKNHEN